jgi:cell division septation protein DedD
VAPAPAQAQAQTPTAVTPAPATGEYTVQVFSFKDKEDADASAAPMKEKGYPAYVLTSNLGDKGTWHRVRIGSYATQAQATEMLKRVQGDYKNGFVVKVTKD